jgi:hypothetical protein
MEEDVGAGVDNFGYIYCILCQFYGAGNVKQSCTKLLKGSVA